MFSLSSRLLSFQEAFLPITFHLFTHYITYESIQTSGAFVQCQLVDHHRGQDLWRACTELSLRTRSVVGLAWGVDDGKKTVSGSIAQLFDR